MTGTRESWIICCHRVPSLLFVLDGETRLAETVHRSLAFLFFFFASNRRPGCDSTVRGWKRSPLYPACTTERSGCFLTEPTNVLKEVGSMCFCQGGAGCGRTRRWMIAHGSNTLLDDRLQQEGLRFALGFDQSIDDLILLVNGVGVSVGVVRRRRGGGGPNLLQRLRYGLLEYGICGSRYTVRQARDFYRHTW